MTEGSILVICIYELTSKFIHIPDLPYSFIPPSCPGGSFLCPNIPTDINRCHLGATFYNYLNGTCSFPNVKMPIK